MKNTDQLVILLERLKQIENTNGQSTISMMTQTFLGMENASMLDTKYLKRYELSNKEMRDPKAKTNSNDAMIFSINKKQIALTFWFKDRVDKLYQQLDFNMSRYVEFEGNKNFILTFSDPDMDIVYRKREYQYLLSVSPSLSLDWCSRKLYVVKKSFQDFGLKQKSSALLEEFITPNIKGNLQAGAAAIGVSGLTVGVGRFRGYDRKSLGNMPYWRNTLQPNQQTPQITPQLTAESDTLSPKNPAVQASSTDSKLVEGSMVRHESDDDSPPKQMQTLQVSNNKGTFRKNMTDLETDKKGGKRRMMSNEKPDSDSQSNSDRRENRGRGNDLVMPGDINPAELPKKKRSGSFDEGDERFDHLFDILGYSFGIEDQISMGYNVGMINKDWNYPMDCIFMIGDQGVYLKTNFMIRYEKDSKTIVSLLNKTEARSYNLAKYYLELEEMTKPFEQDKFTKNKFRKDLFESIDRTYEIRYSDITEVHSKHYIGRYPISLEIWTRQRRPYLLVFNKNQISKCWEHFFEKWARAIRAFPESVEETKKDMRTMNPDTIFFLKKTTEEVNGVSKIAIRFQTEQSVLNKLKKKWQNGFLDNFSYIMGLNACGGRSLKFSSAYYVFPHVVKDYTYFPLKNLSALRTLARPVAVMKDSDLKAYKEKFDLMKDVESRFMFSLLYSTKNSLEHYLYRAMPYTKYQFDLNDGRTDSLGRMFKDFQINIDQLAPKNFIEMLPENFYLEVYLVNVNNLNFYDNETDDQGKLDNVNLPEWANSNPRYFTQTLRQVLECDYANRNLGKWIDLIFGSAQDGEGAYQRTNIFQSHCYTKGPDAVKAAIAQMNDFTNSKFGSMKKQQQVMALVSAYQCGQVPAKLFKDDHPSKIMSADIEKTNIISCILQSTESVGLLSKFTNPLIETLDADSSRAKRLTGLKVCDNNSRHCGPLEYLLSKGQDYKQRSVKVSEGIETVYVLYRNSMLIDNNMIAVLGPNCELLCLTQTSASIAYLNSFDACSYEFFEYNGILWIGNSIGEIFGYTFNLASSESHNSKDKKDKIAQNKEEKSVFYKDKRNIPVVPLSDTSDLHILKNIINNLTGMKMCLDFKTLFHYFFQVSPSGFMKTDAAMFETKSQLVSISHDFHFTLGSTSKITKIKSSSLSNILIACNDQGSIFLCDIFDRCVLSRIHVPHFTQMILLMPLDEKAQLLFRTFLNKELVGVQRCLDLSISRSNEDFAVVSEDFVSVYSSAGMLLATERRKNTQECYTAVCICEVSHSLTSEPLLSGRDHGHRR